MYEKKNKMSQPATVLDKISVRLSEAEHCNVNDKYVIIL